MHDALSRNDNLKSFDSDFVIKTEVTGLSGKSIKQAKKIVCNSVKQLTVLKKEVGIYLGPATKTIVAKVQPKYHEFRSLNNISGSIIARKNEFLL